jgi:hypothetical protein
LRPEEWERQDENAWALFAFCALDERTKRDGFSPRAEPPALHLAVQALTLSGGLLFTIFRSLLLADLIALVTANL